MARLIGFLLAAAAALCVLAGPAAAVAPAAPGQPAAASGPEVVSVGMVPISVYDIDIESGTYYGDFYVWYRWKGEIDPVETTEFTNGVEKWGATATAVHAEPILQPDGSKYQAVRYEGRFDNKFAVSRFPLESERLVVDIENSRYTSDKIVYQAEPAEDLRYEDDFAVQGWYVTGWSATTLDHDYNSAFGQPFITADYSQLQFALDIQRPSSYFTWKLLLPLVVVLLMALGALLISETHVEVRIGLPTTAMLSTVFLQLAYTEDLPSVGTLVLMDYLYILAYLALLAVVGRVIYTGYETKRHANPDYSAKRGDRITLAAVAGVLVIGFALIVAIAP